MESVDFRSVVPRFVPFANSAGLRSLLARALGIDQLEAMYGALRSMSGNHALLNRLLQFLDVTYHISDADLDRIPRTGPALVAVNHPYGILDGAVLAALLGQIRSDVRLLGNEVISVIPELQDLVIPVDLISGRAAVQSNSQSARRSIKQLAANGMLLVFPAGDVSHFQWKVKSITDAEWNPAIARIVAILWRLGIQVPVIPVYVKGANSLLFHITGLLHSGYRTALLGRELLNKRGRCIEVRVGTAVPAEKLLALSTPQEQTRYLRWRTYLLANRQHDTRNTASFRHRPTVSTSSETIVAARPSHLVAREVAALPVLTRSGKLEVYMAGASRIPNVLHELGRLREITFRAAGEGTGKKVDIDGFDAHYLHLFCWDTCREEIVGAYRLARADALGARGLYTATVFDYGDEFIERLGPALELGRFFISAEYQRRITPLLLLWNGIGEYVAQNPQYKLLFGSVSISNRYHQLSRDLMVSFLQKHASLQQWANLLGDRNEFCYNGPRTHWPVFDQSGFDVEDLSSVIADVDPNYTGVPVLLRQYLKLGGKLLGFRVDPMFSYSLDGLILVDLTKADPRLLARYIGKENAASFLKYYDHRFQSSRECCLNFIDSD